MHSPIILFDVDGTLATAEPKVHFEAFGVAIKKVFGIEASIYELDYHGMTAKGIVYSLLRKRGYDNKTIDAKYKEISENVIKYYLENVDVSTIKPLAGVVQLLEELHKRNFIIGALTGNHKQIAEFKLENLGIRDYFSIGSYGEISENRIELFSVAISQAENKIGEKIDKKLVYYFDDSVKGVLAGKEAGIVTIAVATGNYSLGDLSKINPDFVLENLSVLDKVLKIFSPQH